MQGENARTSDFGFRPLRTPEEYRQAEELQREALGPDAAQTVPSALLKGLQDNGGLVLGAFTDIYLAGVTATSIGWDGSTLYQLAHVTVVRPAYQNHRVGFRLSVFLRDEVLRLGLAEVRFAFDPLHRPSAALAVRQLGARPEAYRPNYFGQFLGPNELRDESDRLQARWALSSAEVERRVAGGRPSPGADAARQAGAAPLVETELGESGLRLPIAVSEPAGDDATVEVPFDLASIRTHEARSVRRWRHAVRDAFRIAFDLGFEADDFAVVPIEHERRAFYFLRRTGRTHAVPDPSRP